MRHAPPAPARGLHCASGSARARRPRSRAPPDRHRREPRRGPRVSGRLARSAAVAAMPSRPTFTMPKRSHRIHAGGRRRGLARGRPGRCKEHPERDRNQEGAVRKLHDREWARLSQVGIVQTGLAPGHLPIRACCRIVAVCCIAVKRKPDRSYGNVTRFRHPSTAQPGAAIRRLISSRSWRALGSSGATVCSCVAMSCARFHCCRWA